LLLARVYFHELRAVAIRVKRGDVSKGIAGVNERVAGGGALRRGTGGDGGSVGGTNYRGGIEAAAVERNRTDDATKGDAAKVALAARLRAETTMTVGWIAERLGMGTRGHLNHLLYRRRKSSGE